MSTNSRTRRAGLTYASTSIRQLLQVIIGFVVNPLVIRGLGSELYGTWSVIQQSTNYLALSDLRAASALKLTLGITQHDENWQDKRRQIGAAVVIWACMLPVSLLLGLALIYLLPILIDVSDTSLLSVRVGMTLAVLSTALGGVLSIPQIVLRATNLDYKATITRSFVVVGTGVGSAIAISLGAGIPGLALVYLVSAVLFSLVTLVVAKNTLPWFGVALPSRRDIVQMLRVSGWVLAATIAYLLQNSSDLVLIGILINANVAGVYATMGLVLRIVGGPIVGVLDAGSPGIADLCGRNSIAKVAALRDLMKATSLFAMALIGTGVVTLNQSFITLWIGPGFYYGDAVNVLLVIIAIHSTVTRVDILITDCMLALRFKTIVMMAFALLSIGMAIVLSSTLGLAGIAVAMCSGQVMFAVFMTVYVSRRLGVRILQANEVRLWTTCVLLLIGGVIFKSMVRVAGSWSEFLTEAVVVGCVAFVILGIVGLSKLDRLTIWTFLANVISQSIWQKRVSTS